MAKEETTNTTDTNLSQAENRTLTKPSHMNHKAWKAYIKKMKRKEKRQAEAKLHEVEQDECCDVTTDSEEEKKKAQEEVESQRQHQLWLERERQAQIAFMAKKEWEEKERKRIEEIERKIKEEWEERERKEKEEQEEKERKEREKKEKQDKLLKEATANENTAAWHNPLAPVQYSKEVKVDYCPFFKKTASCRFGDHCSRYHDYPESSMTILIPNMFSSFELEQSIVDNIDTDVSLEYDDNEMYQSFKDFYADVVPEFKKAGTLVQMKVCCNCEPHLRGNVYIQYKRESDAHKAYEIFNARWYGGRQLTCVFVSIDSWKAAICGLASKKRCPKGKSCNFLHVFRNPGGEFSEMDYDQQPSDRYDRKTDRDRNRHYSYNKHNHRDKSRSESVRSHRYRRHSRSRSRERGSKARHKSRSRSISPIGSSRPHSRSKSRSRSPSRMSRSHRSRSHSPVRHSRSHRRSRSTSRSSSRGRSNKRRSRSLTPGHQKELPSKSISDAHNGSKHSYRKRQKSRSRSLSVRNIKKHRSSEKRLQKSSSSSSSSSQSDSSNTASAALGCNKKRKRKHNSPKLKASNNKKPVNKDLSSGEEQEFEYVEKTKEYFVRNR